MIFVNHKTTLTPDRLTEMLENGEAVNRGVKFDEKRGKPQMLVKRKGNRLNITCRYVGGASKDNGFLVGSFFHGKMTVKNGETRLRGIILTAPIYHAALIALTAYYIYRCISLGGINPVPIILIAFSLMMFSGEFKKQGVISRFIARAIRYGERLDSLNIGD